MSETPQHDHAHELCTEEHTGAAAEEWANPHCSLCGLEITPEEAGVEAPGGFTSEDLRGYLREVLDGDEEMVQDLDSDNAQRATLLLLNEAAQGELERAIKALDAVDAAVQAIHGVQDWDLDIMYGEDLAAFFRTAREIVS